MIQLPCPIRRRADAAIIKHPGFLCSPVQADCGWPPRVAAIQPEPFQHIVQQRRKLLIDSAVAIVRQVVPLFWIIAYVENAMVAADAGVKASGD